LENELEEYIPRENVKYLAEIAYEWAYKESRINNVKNKFPDIFLVRQNLIYKTFYEQLQTLNQTQNPNDLFVVEMDVGNLLKQIYKRKTNNQPIIINLIN
jgi:hypothetical protein